MMRNVQMFWYLVVVISIYLPYVYYNTIQYNIYLPYTTFTDGKKMKKIDDRK